MQIKINWDIVITKVTQILPWPIDVWIKKWHMAKSEQWHQKMMQDNPSYKNLVHNIINSPDDITGKNPTGMQE